MTAAYLALLRGQGRAQSAYRTSFAIDLVSNVGATARLGGKDNFGGPAVRR